MESDISGRIEWLRSIVERYQAPLTRYAVSLTGNSENARDVVQDTFARLCSQQRKPFNGTLAQWLFTVCRRRALDLRRKEMRMARLLELNAAPLEEKTPFRAAEEKESSIELLALVATLPRNQRDVIRLKFQNGFSYEEISRATNLSVSNVGFLLHTAIKTLRAKMGASPAKGRER
jgi:RNA polymerase sigma-70 factor (ECF subfamily)